MESVETTNWVRLVAEIGALVMCAALVGYAVYTAIHTFKKWFDHKLTKTETAEKSDEKSHDERAAHRNQVGKTIMALLERTLHKTHSDRVYVFEFHNGNQSFGGLPFLKMTNTYEAHEPRVKPEIHKRESMPFLLFQSFVDAIYAKEYVIMDVGVQIDEFTSAEYGVLEARDIQFTLRAKITDLNRKVIGYLGIDYCVGSPVTREAAEVHIETLLNAATELGALLSVNNNKREV